MISHHHHPITAFYAISLCHENFESKSRWGSFFESRSPSGIRQCCAQQFMAEVFSWGWLHVHVDRWGNELFSFDSPCQSLFLFDLVLRAENWCLHSNWAWWSCETRLDSDMNDYSQSFSWNRRLGIVLAVFSSYWCLSCQSEWRIISNHIDLVSKYLGKIHTVGSAYIEELFKETAELYCWWRIYIGQKEGTLKVGKL